MIDVKGLTKQYDSITAINNLSFNINKGEIIGFLGPNGAGKTTTMKLLTCFMPPTSGKATINGLSITEDAFEIKRMIGYLPENNPLYPDMTVLDYLKFISHIRKIEPSHQQSQIKRVIDLCELGQVLTKPIEECSKGFKQRVGLAQALMHKPEILILDEPTVGLDPNQIIEIRHLIKELGKETTIVLCSHILSEVSATCSRVFILKKGNIIANGSPKELQATGSKEKNIFLSISAPKDILEKALNNHNITITSIKEIGTNEALTSYKITSSDDCRTQLFNIAVKEKWILNELRIEETSLEDIFIELTKEKS
ncbi:MAG: ABC transporter [Rickettsiales bacterium]|nr:ABC transporter [Rickettsiales bacterium]|tara:strand:+ start:4553 stop:5485 length:933 start_codon:yes stop_codon:yes gene_type:complete